MKHCLTLAAAGLLVALQTTHAEDRTRPNIVVILTDDQGYADFGMNPDHAEEVETPNMDALAKDGVLFSQAYTSGHVCSPTRAGLMIGGYSQRVGVYTAGDGGRGFDPTIKLFPSYLPEEYVSGVVGKWHLGLDDDYPDLKWHALNRGFDECYKFMGRGGHSYFDLRSDSQGKFMHPIYRNKQRINDEGYLTNRLTEEAVDFIERNKDRPFFLYLAYNAVHSPAEAPEADIARVVAERPELSRERAILMAMLHHLDQGVGDVVAKLKKEELFDNTLLFFLTDNGGAKGMRADNSPLRGFKSSLDEGGIRTPFIVSWPARFAGGTKIDTPVISFDILPTVLDVTDSFPADHDFDGKSLLPLLSGEQVDHHDQLFWSKGKEDEWAVRRGNWKLHQRRGSIELVNLAEDPAETVNLADGHPEVVRELSAAFDAWLAPMAEPITGGAKRVDQDPTNGSAPSPRRRNNRNRNRDRRGNIRTSSDGTAVRSEAANPKPNILLIVCDDLNSHVSPSGYESVHTPTLAALAQDSMVFQRAYCQYPVCGPSRASFLSGLYPESTGVLDNKSDIREQRPDLITLPQHFKNSGYWTASIGKVFHSTRHEFGELAWDEFVRFENDELPSVALAKVDFELIHGSIDRPENRRRWRTIRDEMSAPLNAQTPPGHGRSGLLDEQHKDGKNVRQVVGWLREQPFEDKPFLIALGIQKPHVPFLAPDKYFDMYPKDEISFEKDPDALWESLPADAASGRYKAFGFELGVENEALRKEYMQAYHACISFIDSQIGLVVEELKTQDQWDNTIVIFTSDHGYHLGDHFLWGKVTLFDIGTRVPFIVRVPGMTKAGSRSEALVELVDIFPTLSELAELDAPKHLQGLSLVPQLREPSTPSDRSFAYSVVTRRGGLGFAIRNRTWRYTKWPRGEELYDLQTDPSERVNLASNPNYRERLLEMRDHLGEVQAAANVERSSDKQPTR